MIEVENLTKFFGGKKAVDDISFTVKKGEILGFLGPNGAGKSTTMRMITGYIPPSSGRAVIGGADIRTASLEARKKMGYLSETTPVYPDMTVVGFLGFCAEIRGFKSREKEKKIDEITQKCFLSSVRHQPIHTLSKGYKQRVSFAQSIIHDPEYLILDEPTDGLDPNQKHEVRLMIREMSRDKVIILSTHILDEVDAVCSRAIIINSGRIIADDTPRGLHRLSAGHGSVVVSIDPSDKDAALDQLGKIEDAGRVEIKAPDEKELAIQVFPGKSAGTLAASVSAALGGSGISVNSLYVEQGRLDDVFRMLTGNGSEAH